MAVSGTPGTNPRFCGSCQRNPLRQLLDPGERQRQCDEDQRVPVGEPHGRCLRCLRSLHQAHGPRINALGSGCRYAQLEWPALNRRGLSVDGTGAIRTGPVSPYVSASPRFSSCRRASSNSARPVLSSFSSLARS